MDKTIKIIKALKQAESIKATNEFCKERKKGSFAQYCKCKEGELCLMILARVLNWDDANLLRYINKRPEIFNVRKIENPRNCPRTYISLKEGI